MSCKSNGFPVAGLVAETGQRWITSSAVGSPPLALMPIADFATARRFAGVNVGVGPRFLSVCFPGSQPAPLSTFATNYRKDASAGLVPSTRLTFLATQDTFGLPDVVSSLLASR